MKLGILGTGKIVQEFLPWLVEHTPFTVQAVCSTPRSAAKAAELCAQYQIPQHTTNYFELLQWVDVVYIAVPNLQHARYARVALEAGKHVIVEKPMAVTAAETEELAALAQRKRLFLFEAMTTQYQPNYAKLRELLPRVGTVRMVQCSFSQYSSRYDAFCAGDVQPAFDPACAGGALMDLGVYHKVIVASATEPVAVLDNALAANDGKEYDLSICCVNIENCEMSAILPVRDDGLVYFFSMATSFTKAALGAEGVGKDVTMIIGNGYTKNHAEITLNVLRENPKLRKLFDEKYC